MKRKKRRSTRKQKFGYVTYKMSDIVAPDNYDAQVVRVQTTREGIVVEMRIMKP